MNLVFLGTGGYHPNERRHTAGILLPEAGILLDAGTGLFRLTSYLQTSSLHILLSHAHLDHVCGLTYLLVPLSQGVLTSVVVYGDRDTLTAVKDHLFAPPIFPVLPAVEFKELQEGTELQIEPGLRVTHHRLSSHPGGSLAFRITWMHNAAARSLAYVTDTAVDGSYTEFIREASLLIHECFYPDGREDWAIRTGHSCTSQVARLAAECRVGRLILTHIDPQHPEEDPLRLTDAQTIFPATELAEDCLSVSID